MKKETNANNPYRSLSVAPIKAPNAPKTPSPASATITGSKDMRVKAGK